MMIGAAHLHLHHAHREHRDEEERPSIIQDEADAMPGIPVHLREKYNEVWDLPILAKWNKADFMGVTMEEVHQIVSLLGDEGDEGLISIERMALVFKHFIEPNCTTDQILVLFESFKRQDDAIEEKATASPGTAAFAEPDPMEPLPEWMGTVMVTAEEIHQALTGPAIGFFQQMRMKESTTSTVTREFFVEQVAFDCDRNDAFMDLPKSAIYLLVFLFLVTGHLRVSERHLLETSLEAWTNGRDPRTDCESTVDNMNKLWGWITREADDTLGTGGSGLSDVTGAYTTDEATGAVHLILANRNVLLGDIQLAVTYEDGSKKSQWLLHSDVAKAYLASHPKDEDRFFRASKAAAQDLKANGWDARTIEYLSMKYSTYNSMARMFAMTEVRVPFGPSGDVIPKINTDAMSVEPYPSRILLVWDAIFLILVLRMWKGETVDVCASLRQGFGEFLDYWQFWNVVDWISIFFGILICALWFQCMQSMQNPVLAALIDTNYELTADVMALTDAQLDDITAKLATLRLRYAAMQITMAANTISIVMKFFKGFQSNARLKVVTDTFKSSAEDFAHFFVIFSAVFLPFVVVGHVLFGSDITEFSSLPTSINTGVTVLMGDFGWYTELTEINMSGRLPSGTPKWVLFAWFFSYNFIVLLVLLNMLLAVILEHYTNVAGTVAQMIDAPSLVTQMRRYRRFKKETKKFIPLEELRLGLENDVEPKHPDEVVTAFSLNQAWPEMTKEQADWIMTWLQDLADKKASIHHEGEDMQETDAAIDVLNKNSEALQAIADAVQEKNSKQEAKTAEDDPQVAKISKSLRMLVDSMSQLQREQFRLSKRIEELQARAALAGNTGSGKR
eukprot:TRINITY_DN120820_c0_g1_i1.p1 TRINITY_DN120820_c0_g1~~TRINITY_DN120820_c0_g1_i1.p1  ORF type:complete len:847 (+),score=201.01 TRINITY_DN120820_c0_g1_i1:197-2737(+)